MIAENKKLEEKETDIGTIVTLGVMVGIVTAAGIIGAIFGYLSKVPSKQVYAMVKKIEKEGKKATLSGGTTLETLGNDLVVKMPYLDKPDYYTITDFGSNGLKEELKGIPSDIAELKVNKYNDAMAKALIELRK